MTTVSTAVAAAVVGDEDDDDWGDDEDADNESSDQMDSSYDIPPTMANSGFRSDTEAGSCWTITKCRLSSIAESLRQLTLSSHPGRTGTDDALAQRL